MSKGLIEPHGGTLINRVIEGREKEDAISRAETLKKLPLSDREISDLEMIAVGAFSPIEGFMCKDDYDGVVDKMHLSNGLPWSVPVTLSTSADTADTLKKGEEVALTNNDGEVLALMVIEDIYDHDKKREAEKVYKTTEEAHPGVKVIYAMGEKLLGGKISVVKRAEYDDFLENRLDPAETRILFEEKGWKRVVGFQTRNPIHRAHEYLTKCALEVVDGLMIHPLVGATKADDIPADVRMDCYKALMDGYYPKNRVALVVLPAAMRYAGPREAIFHALIRKNYGCTHFIVGRDHAGVGSYYGTFDAHHIFDEFTPEEIGITPMFFDYTFYCKKCEGMASTKSCPHEDEDRISLSGTKVREMLREGIEPPHEFSRSEVARILINSMKK